MAIEKVALDYSDFSMQQYRESLTKSVDALEETFKNTPKVAIRQRIKASDIKMPKLHMVEFPKV